MIYPENRNSCLAKDFMNFVETSFEPENKPVVYMENQLEKDVDLQTPWILFSSDVFNRVVTTLGEKRRFLRQGMIKIKINVPIGSRTSVLNDITDMIVDHYEGKIVSGVCITDILVDKDISQKESAWFNKIIRILYRYYTVK